MPHVLRNGAEIYYESYGRGMPLVFLHPVNMNRYAWSGQIFAFARRHRVIVLDHRGHGLSTRPSQGYGVPDMAADLVAVLDHAEVERAVMVGNSIGGMIALQTALDVPERVIANCIVSSATDMAPTVPETVFQAYAEDFPKTYGHILGGATSARTKRRLPEVCAYIEDVYRYDANASRDVFLASMRDPQGLFHWNIRERLRDISQPTLVIAGEEDLMLPPGAAAALAEGIPAAEFKNIAEVGHLYPLEQPTEFNRDLREFLERRLET